MHPHTLIYLIFICALSAQCRLRWSEHDSLELVSAPMCSKSSRNRTCRPNNCRATFRQKIHRHPLVDSSHISYFLAKSLDTFGIWVAWRRRWLPKISLGWIWRSMRPTLFIGSAGMKQSEFVVVTAWVRWRCSIHTQSIFRGGQLAYCSTSIPQDWPKCGLPHWSNLQPVKNARSKDNEHVAGSAHADHENLHKAWNLTGRQRTDRLGVYLH